MNERINMIERNYRRGLISAEDRDAEINRCFFDYLWNYLNRKDKSINEIVAFIHPDYVSVNNCPGGCTGDAKVKSFQFERRWCQLSPFS